MFYVLLYDAYCITVPAIWMNLQQDTFRMPKKCKQLTVACIKQMLPCVDWNTLAFHKKFGPYETYQQARSIEKAISEMSASDDNIVIPKGNSENSPKKRLIKKPKLYDDTSSSDEPKRDNITMPSNYIPIESEYVLDPSNELNKSLITKPAYECTELNEDSNLESVFDGWVNVVNKSNLNSLSKEISEASKNMFPMQQKRAALEPPVASSSERSTGRPVILSDVIIHPIANNITCEMPDTNDSKSYDDKRDNYQDKSLNNKENLNEIQSTRLEHTSCCKKCRQECYTKFATLERKLNWITHFLQNGREVQNEVDFSLLPSLPLITVEQIQNFNKQLENTNIRRQFIERMSQVGGETVAKNVRNIMIQTIGYEAAQAYTWIGQKKNTLSMKNSKLSDTIIGQIMN